MMRKQFYILSALFLVFVACSSASKSFGEKIDQVIEDSEDRFESCVDLSHRQKRQGKGEAYGEIEIVFTISPKGKVIDSNLVKSTTNDPSLDKCFQETVRSLKFPEHEEGRLTETTYLFKMNEYR